MGCANSPIDNQEDDDEYDNNINRGRKNSLNDKKENEDDEQFKDFEEMGSN